MLLWFGLSGLFNLLSLLTFFSAAARRGKFFYGKNSRELRLTRDAWCSAGLALDATLSPWARKGAGNNFASQNYCSPLHPGLQFQFRKPAAGGLAELEQWNAESVSHPGFFTRRDLRRKSLRVKKCAQNLTVHPA
jgi:hypothetical protein